eukprot:TRINITY_DN1817_c0_g1_i1.p1 TRINITY_DN1817_c0_g1~~TRINITY_DN1817_c0_g1_i1.p1  ORF type:complete len:638 (+),score=76.53 TRINITY_DN1817_c0_g1_i1:270-1916(+)
MCEFAHSEEELGIPWACEACGFLNVEMNVVCGGRGSLGCKAPKPVDRATSSRSSPYPATEHAADSWSAKAYSLPLQASVTATTKRSMCKFFQHGTCSRGDACEFAHDKAELGTPWECSSCSFTNVEANDVCGGSGPKGCKEPKPKRSVDSEMSEILGLLDAYHGTLSQGRNQTAPKIAMCKFFSQGACSRAASCEFAHDEAELGICWPCEYCGFVNVEVNAVCGGSGRKGCKKPKPRGKAYNFGNIWQGDAGARQGSMQLSHASHSAAAKRSMCKFFQQGACSRGDACQFAHDKAELGTPWQCSSCGFTNVEANEVCGGSGTKGCKMPKPHLGADISRLARLGGKGYRQDTNAADMNQQFNLPFAGQQFSLAGDQAEAKKAMCKFFLQGSCKRGSMCEFAHSEAELGEMWQCAGCGFTNVQANDVCGGGGRLGCKMPRPQRSFEQQTAAKRSMCKFFLQGACTKGEGCDFAHNVAELGVPWTCGMCTFVNVAANEVCGGSGRMGCKAPKQQSSQLQAPSLERLRGAARSSPYAVRASPSGSSPNVSVK